jgi:hypothetical protein
MWQKIIHKAVELCLLSLTCNAEELSAITSAASLSALLAFCSPSAAITLSFSNVFNIVIYAIKILNGLYDEIFLTVLMLTLALASLAASASAAIALCSCTGSRTSFLSSKYYIIKIA